MSNSQKFIICKGSSGMGNRILSACTALLYAKITERQAVIDWRDGVYAEPDVNSFPLFFDCPNVASLDELPDTSSIYPELWIGNSDKAFGAIKEELKQKGLSMTEIDRQISLNLSKGNYEQDIVVFCNYTQLIHKMIPLFKGKFQYLRRLTRPQILQSIIAQEIQLTETVKNTIDDYKQQYFNQPTVGVHVRYTDMKIPVEDILINLQKVLEKKADSQIFLATDSQEILDKFNQKFDKVLTTQKWFPPPGERAHQNWDHCPDRFQNGVEALTDLYLLASCDSLVFSSQSSFGYIARLLSKADPQDIYDINAPNQWMSRLIRLRKKAKRFLNSLSSR